MIDIEPDWRSIGHIIARDSEKQHRQAIEQMANIMSIVRYAQRGAEQGHIEAKQLLDLFETSRKVRDGESNYGDGKGSDQELYYIRNGHNELALREVVDYVADLGCDDYPSACDCVTCKAMELRELAGDSGVCIYRKD